jgi:hypothetical protein
LKDLNVFGEVLAVLKIKLLLSALFGRARNREALSRRIAKDTGPELLIYQRPAFSRYAGLDCCLEAVKSPVCGGDFAVCAAVKSPCQPNIFVSNEPR